VRCSCWVLSDGDSWWRQNLTVPTRKQTPLAPRAVTLCARNFRRSLARTSTRWSGSLPRTRRSTLLPRRHAIFPRSYPVRDAALLSQVDVLIDLNGHTLGSGLQILSYRPARTQITFLGFPQVHEYRCANTRVIGRLELVTDNRSALRRLLPVRSRRSLCTHRPRSRRGLSPEADRLHRIHGAASAWSVLPRKRLRAASRTRGDGRASACEPAERDTPRELWELEQTRPRDAHHVVQCPSARASGRKQQQSCGRRRAEA
jgi:hypothetical protein